MACGAFAVGHCHFRFFVTAGMHEAMDKKARFCDCPARHQGLYAH